MKEERARETEILCIGNALVDVFARGEEGAAGCYGISGPVQHLEAEKLKEYISTLPGYTAGSGGGAANAAKIAGLLGAKVSFSGSLGRDDAGRLFETELSEAGVKLRLIRRPSPTGICLILAIPKTNEPRVAASPGAALEFSKRDISREEIKNAKLVLIDGYMMTRPGMAGQILRLAARYKTAAALDTGSAEIAGKFARELAEYADAYPLILFMNEDEALAFYRANAGDVSDAAGETFRKACLYFESLTRGRDFPIIVVKRGKLGAMCFAREGGVTAETAAITPNDTTGAGDAFCAGFLCAWTRGRPVRECAGFGNKTAALVLDVPGTKAGAEKFRELALALA